MGTAPVEATVIMCAALDTEYQAIREQIPDPVVEVEERGTLYEVAALPTAYVTWRAVLVLTDRYNTAAAVQVGKAIAAFGPQAVLLSASPADGETHGSATWSRPP
jgi:hypothetical protein